MSAIIPIYLHANPQKHTLQATAKISVGLREDKNYSLNFTSNAIKFRVRAWNELDRYDGHANPRKF